MLRLAILAGLLAIATVTWGQEAVGPVGAVLTLEQAVALALQNNRQVQNATLEVGKKIDQAAAAWTSRLPAFNMYFLFLGFREQRNRKPGSKKLQPLRLRVKLDIHLSSRVQRTRVTIHVYPDCVGISRAPHGAASACARNGRTWPPLSCATPALCLLHTTMGSKREQHGRLRCRSDGDGHARR